MRKDSRRLLKIAILGSIVPLSGAQAPAFAEPVRGECPYARAAAEAEAARMGATTVTIETAVPEGSLLGGGEHPSAFLP